ncbi:MAG TPA: hypothetical protein DIT07_08890 [Sphingobacteriaceae bacterium]|nr:hypothetical protein [Sphingobacteriaceae bacterium]
MAHSFGYIYLSWRKGNGYSRHIVGVIKINSSGNSKFAYISHAVKEARSDGFTPYTEFPDLDKEYTENVLEIFSQRLIKSERGDISTFLDFWEIPHKYADDKLYLLAHTQGWLPTDNFEFLADFNPTKKACFVTDLAGLTRLSIPSDRIAINDILTFKTIPMKEDKYAVQVYKDDLFLGYIKKIHNRIFYKKTSHKLKIKVKAIEKNGILKRVFLKISS